VLHLGTLPTHPQTLDYTRVDNGALKGVSFWYDTDSPANIKLGWKRLPVTSAPAYYKNSELTAVKSFITFALIRSNDKPKK
jgi:hypothetical protein